MEKQKKCDILILFNLDLVLTANWVYNYLESSLCLVNTSTNCQVVNGRMLNNPFLVNNEQSSQCNSLYHRIYSELLGHKFDKVEWKAIILMSTLDATYYSLHP